MANQSARKNLLEAARAVVANARKLQKAKVGSQSTSRILMELKHDLEDAMNSLRVVANED